MMKKPINQFFLSLLASLWLQYQLIPIDMAEEINGLIIAWRCLWWLSGCLVECRGSINHFATTPIDLNLRWMVWCYVPSLPRQCLHKFVLPSSIKCLNICPLEGGWLNWWRLFKLLRNKDGQGELPTHKTTIVRSTRRCLPKLSWQTMKGDNSTPEAMAKENVLTLCGRETDRCAAGPNVGKPDPWQWKCQKAKTISTYWVPFGVCGWEIFIKTI